jgi:hypothetical protein
MIYSVEIAESLIRDALRAHPGLEPEDLRLECYPNGTMVVVVIEKSEKWLDWLSDNHGWAD